ncbi:toll/interleukin-1 receptor domain-containing protein [Oculatella sp. FACHB-28]|nr:toll/interleukin-1 receptor domain-containing protein [Oculatella sp. FACHB-28]
MFVASAPHLDSSTDGTDQDVFISYSRADKTFVKSLYEKLSATGRGAWVDWEDIPITAEWWREIEAGIESTNTFVFIISPASVQSKVCRQEIDHAVFNHKRLLPIVWREGFEQEQVHPALRRHNWLFFRESDDSDQALQSLINVSSG